MALQDQRISLILNRGRQLGRSLLLLVHYMSVFVAFVGHTVQWMVEAVRWTCVFARYTTSMFDSIYRLLHWGKRRSVTGGGREMCPTPDMQPE